MSLRDIILAVISVFLWAANIYAQKKVAQEISPLLLSFLRIGILIPLVFIFPKAKNKAWHYMLAGLFWNAFNFIFLNLGWQLGVGVAVSSFVIQTNVFFSIIICSLMFNERPSIYQVFGMIIACSGVTLLASTKGTMEQENWLIGIGVMLMASISWGIGFALIKKFRIGSSMNDITWLSFYSSLPLLAVTLLFDGPVTVYDQLMRLSPDGWGCILFAVIASTIMASRMWLYLTNKYHSSYLVPYLLLIPIFAIVIALLLTDEVLTSMQIVSGTLILIGVFVSQVVPHIRPWFTRNYLNNQKCVE